jgi:hypothetical protein
VSDKPEDSRDPLANELDMWQRAGAASFLEFERNLADNLTDPQASSGGSSEGPPSDATREFVRHILVDMFKQTPTEADIETVARRVSAALPPRAASTHQGTAASPPAGSPPNE